LANVFEVHKALSGQKSIMGLISFGDRALHGGTYRYHSNSSNGSFFPTYNDVLVENLRHFNYPERPLSPISRSRQWRCITQKQYETH